MHPNRSENIIYHFNHFSPPFAFELGRTDYAVEVCVRVPRSRTYVIPHIEIYRAQLLIHQTPDSFHVGMRWGCPLVGE